jgi:glycosyltransferase involved in cell wall biosynthesis
VSCISKAMMELAETWGQAATVYLPVGLASDVAIVSQTKARAELGIDRDEFVVGLLFTDSPDLPLIQQVITSLAKSNSQIKFMIMGPGVIFEHKPDTILFNDFVDREELSNYLAACDLGWVPFTDKPINRFRYPNKIGDFFAAHRPILSSDIGEVGLLLNQSDSGWLVEPSLDGYLKKLDQLQKDPSQISHKQQQVVQFKNNLTWQKAVHTLKQSYLSS